MKHTGKDAGANIAETRFVFWRRATHEAQKRGLALWLMLDEVRDRLRGMQLKGEAPPALEDLLDKIEKCFHDNPSCSYSDEKRR